MNIDVQTVLKNYDGTDLTHSVEEGGQVVQKPLTFLYAVISAINTAYPGEVRTPDMIVKITGLSNKFYQNPQVALTKEDIDFIQDRVMKSVQYDVWKPVVYGKICEMLTSTN